MNEYGSTIRLQHEYAARFFEEAMNPDLEELRQRDAFFAILEQECPVHTEGTDLVSEIPDIDVAALLGLKRELGEYVSINDDSFEVSFVEKGRNRQSHSAYDSMSMFIINIAA